MCNFFEYCFYRIHSWYLKYKIDTQPRVYSAHWVCVGTTSNLMTFIQIFCYFINIKFELLLLLLPIHAMNYWINYSFLLTDRKYKELEKKYKKEKFKKIKGFGVILYLISSLIIWIICLIYLKNTSTNYKFDFDIIKFLSIQ